MFSASRLLLQLSVLMASTAMAVNVDPAETERKLREAAANIPKVKRSFEGSEVYQAGGQSFGSTPGAQRAANAINGNAPNRTYGTRTKTFYAEVPDYEAAAAVMTAVGTSASSSTDFNDAFQRLSANENTFSNKNIQSGSLTSLVMGDDGKVGSAGTSGHRGASSADISADKIFAAFKETTTTQSGLLANQFASDARNPPELEKAKQDAQKKFEEDQAKAQADMARQAQANANKNGAGGGGAGGGGGGGGGLEPPKTPDPGRGIASFDPSKFQPPKVGNEIASALASAGQGGESGGSDNGPLINPVTMSGNGFPQQQQNAGDSKMLADTNDKGFKLGGPKSVPQTLTTAAGAFPPNNAQNAGGPGGTPGMGGGKGSPGGDSISGDPYAGVGKEAPYKSVNYNLVKDGGYGSSSGGGGDEGGGAGGDKDGEVDGGSPEAKEMISNITRPGQFLPAAGNAETGYPGIFAYRGYIRKVCNLEGTREQVALCKRPINFAQKAPAPLGPETESFIASAQKPN